MWNFINSTQIQNNKTSRTNYIHFWPMLHQIGQIGIDLFSYFTTPPVGNARYVPSLDDEQYQAYRVWRRHVKQKMKKLRDTFAIGITPNQLYQFLVALQEGGISPAYYHHLLSQLSQILTEQLQSPHVFLKAIDDARQVLYNTYTEQQENALICFYDDLLNGIIEYSRKTITLTEGADALINACFSFYAEVVPLDLFRAAKKCVQQELQQGNERQTIQALNRLFQPYLEDTEDNTVENEPAIVPEKKSSQTIHQTWGKGWETVKRHPRRAAMVAVGLSAVAAYGYRSMFPASLSQEVTLFSNPYSSTSQSILFSLTNVALPILNVAFSSPQSHVGSTISISMVIHLSSPLLPVVDASEALLNADRVQTNIQNTRMVGDEFQPNTYTAGDQSKPAVAALSNGFVTVWQSNGQDGSGYGVYGQIFNLLGEKVGNEFRVNTYTTNSQRNPAVAAFKEGSGFVVTWDSDGQDTSWYGVYGQRFDALGNKVGGEFPVNTYITGAQQSSAITVLNEKDELVVAWTSDGEDTSGTGVYGQLFNATHKIGNEFLINDYINGNQGFPAIATLTNNNFVVTWTAESNLDTSGNGVLAAIFDKEANRVTDGGGVINVYTLGNQEYSAIAPLTDGKSIIVWQSDGQIGSSYEIYGQVINASRGGVTGEFRANSYTTDSQTNPVVTSWPGTDKFVVAWQSLGQDTSGNGVYLQVCRIDGNEILQKVGSELRVNDDTDDNQENPTVAILTNNNIVLSWQSYLKDGSGYGIAGKIIDTHLSATHTNQTINYIEDTTYNLPPIVITWPTFVSTLDVTFTLSKPRAIAGMFKTRDVICCVNAGYSNDGVWYTYPNQPAADVNNWLSYLEYIPALHFHDNFTITVSISDGFNPPLLDTIEVFGTAVNDVPIVVNNRLVISQGTTVTLHSGLLSATDVEHVASELQWTMSDVKRGQFEHVNEPNQSITTFTQQMVEENLIRFVHNGDSRPPEYNVSVSDGESATAPAAVDVTFLGEEFQVNTYFSDQQYFPAVAVSDEGTVVIVWGSRGQEGQESDGSGIFGQIFNSDLTKRGNEFQINSYESSDQLDPAVSFIDSNMMVVVWGSFGRDGSNWGISGQILDAFGAKLGPEFQVNTFTADTQNLAVVSKSGNENFVVIWEDAGSHDGDGAGIFGQIFHMTGSKVGSEFQVNSLTDGSQYTPAVAAFGNGNFIVVWQHRNQERIRGQILSALGSKIGSEFQVSTSGGYNSAPKVAVINGNILAIWQYGFNGAGSEVHGQLFDLLGNKMGSEFRVDNPPTDDAYGAIGASNNGYFMTAWLSAGNQGIFGQIFNTAGESVGPRFVINTFFNNYAGYYPSIAPLESDFIVTWTGYPDAYGLDNSGEAILAKRIRLRLAATHTDQVIRYKEDEPYPLTSIVVKPSIFGTSSVNATLLLSDPTVGQLTPTQVGNVTSTYDMGNGIWQAYGSVENVNDLLTNIEFIPQLNFNGNATIAVRITDGFSPEFQNTMPLIGIAVDDPPVVVINQLTIFQGERVVLNATQLDAIDIDTPRSSLQWTVSAVTHGQFENISEPGQPLTMFSQPMLENNNIQFEHDDTSEPPSYNVSVSDGTTTTPPTAASITFYPELTTGTTGTTRTTATTGTTRTTGTTATTGTTETTGSTATTQTTGSTGTTRTTGSTGTSGTTGSTGTTASTATTRTTGSTGTTKTTGSTATTQTTGSTGTTRTTGSTGTSETTGSTGTTASTATTRTTGSTGTTHEATSGTTDRSTTDTTHELTSGTTDRSTTGTTSMTSSITRGELTTHEQSSSTVITFFLIGAAGTGGILLLLAGIFAILFARRPLRTSTAEGDSPQKNEFEMQVVAIDKNTIDVEAKIESSEQPAVVALNNPLIDGTYGAMPLDEPHPRGQRVTGKHGIEFELLPYIDSTLVNELYVRYGFQKKDKTSAIGAGNSGTVHLARRLDTKEIVAVKQVSPNSQEKIAEFQVEFQLETNSQHQVRNVKNVGQLIDEVMIQDEKGAPIAYLFTVFGGRGDCQHLVDRLKLIQPQEKIPIVRYLLQQLLDAVNAIHTRNVYHLDIKPANVVLDKDFNLNLIDFGLAYMGKNSDDYRLVRKPLGDARYWPPEGANYYRTAFGMNNEHGATDKIHAGKCDSWMLGVTLTEFLLGEFPWSLQEVSQMDETGVLHTNCKLIEQKWHDSFYQQVIQQLQRRLNDFGIVGKVITGLLHLDPEQRFSASRALRTLNSEPFSISEENNAKQRLRYSYHPNNGSGENNKNNANQNGQPHHVLTNANSPPVSRLITLFNPPSPSSQQEVRETTTNLNFNSSA